MYKMAKSPCGANAEFEDVGDTENLATGANHAVKLVRRSRFKDSGEIDHAVQNIDDDTAWDVEIITAIESTNTRRAKRVTKRQDEDRTAQKIRKGTVGHEADERASRDVQQAKQTERHRVVKRGSGETYNLIRDVGQATKTERDHVAKEKNKKRLSNCIRSKYGFVLWQTTQEVTPDVRRKEWGITWTRNEPVNRIMKLHMAILSRNPSYTTNQLARNSNGR